MTLTIHVDGDWASPQCVSCGKSLLEGESIEVNKTAYRVRFEYRQDDYLQRRNAGCTQADTLSIAVYWIDRFLILVTGMTAKSLVQRLILDRETQYLSRRAF